MHHAFSAQSFYSNQNRDRIIRPKISMQNCAACRFWQAAQFFISLKQSKRVIAV